MSEYLDNDDTMIGLELGLMSQEQVVSEFQELVDRDIVAATDRYTEFAEELERVASGDSTQVRSLTGGPDSLSRARLVDIMTNSYDTASDDVKERVRDEAMRPLLRDNFFYARSAVARITNPYLVGDIIRKEPLVNPGANYYEEGLLKTGDAKDPDLLKFWLGKFDHNLFAANSIALQRGQEANVARVIADNEPLFQDAAHVTAATHDLFAEIKTVNKLGAQKDELTTKYRASFVDTFGEMIRHKAEQANWLPIGSRVLQLYSS
ncbi:MAG: hypothetical protein U5L95_04780 [Candidatus Saccharibacteria bacterium]|nr:hypothetical protein [Candidatus Saccharibacteria bacterium]